jgi:hypothetical protein
MHLLLALQLAAGAAQADRAAGAAQADRAAIVVQAEGAPVTIAHAVVLEAPDGPPILRYAATNVTGQDFDQFTVMVLVFDPKGVLTSRHIAPGRHLLDAGTTKFSAMVLDGAPIGPADTIVVGMNQAQAVGSDTWWRADIRTLAESAIKNRTLR